MKNKFIIHTILLFSIFQLAKAQAIPIVNGNMNGTAGNSQMPTGWTASIGYTPTNTANNSPTPDVLSTSFTAFNNNAAVAVAASPNGGTWVGISSSINENEAIKQTITGLNIGQQYSFTMYVANFGGGSLTSPGKVSAWINGVKVGESPTLLLIGSTWTTMKVSFTATTTSAEFLIDAEHLSGTGGYYSIDGISNLGNMTTPTIGSNKIANSCPTSTGNLTTLVTSTAPSGTTLTFHTANPATTANKIANPTTASTGIYYAAYWDATNNYYSPVSEPIYVAKCLTNTCPSTTVDLTTHSTGTPPSGTTLQWHTSNTPSSGTLVSTPNAVGNGTYYAIYYDATNNCYGSVSTPIIVSISSCFTDSDGDGIADNIDLDDDNDGILDTNEGYCESQSLYTLDLNATLAGASIMANGGTFNLVYTLTSGTPVAGLGNSFNVPFTYSDFVSNTPQDHTWEGFNIDTNLFSIRPNTTQLYTNLPINNSTTKDISGAPFPVPDSRLRYLLNNASINYLGTFTTTIGNLPTVSGLISTYISSNLNMFSRFNMSVSDAINSQNAYYAKMQLQTNVNTVNSGRTLPYSSSYGMTYIWDYTAYSNIDGVGAGNTGLRGLISIEQNTITYCNHRDTDGDGIPNYLDLDSDNDGCLDALEGGANITPSQLVNAGGTVTVGTGSTAANQNLCAASNCVDANGIPTVVSGGQSVGDSQNTAIQSGCYCYKPAITSGTVLDTKFGITALGRAGANNGNWPMVRKGAWIALEAKTKGFVVNRLTAAQIAAIPTANCVEGMMVYDTTNNCLKIYTTTDNGVTYNWQCFNTQTCP